MSEQKYEDAGAPGAGGNGGAERRQEWLRQLQTMIDEVATQAGPAVRDVAAKAAELAQKAAEAATPYAARAADVTAEVSQRLSERSREVAAELHQKAAEYEAKAPVSGDGHGEREPVYAGEPTGNVEH